MSGLPVELLQAALAQASTAVIITDAAGRVLFVNEAFKNLTASELKSAIGLPITDLLELPPEAMSAREVGSLWEGNVRWLKRGCAEPSFHVLQNTLVSPSAKLLGRAFFLSKLSESVTAARAQINQEKLATLGSLTGEIAHDLNNVLTGVLGHVSYLRLALPEKGDHAESAQAIEAGARRAASMTNRILEYARGQQVKNAAVNLSMVLSGGINLLSAALPRNLKLHIEADEKDLYVLGDESQLSQIVLNLIVNARDALPDGGNVYVSLAQTRYMKRVVGGGEERIPGAYAKLTVRDDGMGIETAVLKRIFEPFFTTKSGRGTGLGLSTVASIVQSLSGSIVVESAPGVGTQFEVYFPLHGEVPEPERDSELLLPTGSERILVVDDEEAVRTVVQRSLEHLGYSVEIAASGSEALDCYTRNGAYSLVILDMMMPQMSGDEVFFRLQEFDESVSVLIASGYASDARTQAVLRAGGLGFIQKPFAVEELAREVRRCIDGEPL